MQHFPESSQDRKGFYDHLLHSLEFSVYVDTYLASLNQRTHSSTVLRWKPFFKEFGVKFLPHIVTKMGQEFSKDGSATKVFENIPVLGFFATIGHAANGHHDHAKRAAAKCTNSTLAVGGAIAGSFVGNPALGAMVGGAVGSAVGIGSEHGVSKHIKSEEVS